MVKKKIQTRLLEIAFERKTDNCSSQMRLECKTDYYKRFSIQFTIFPIQFISKDMDSEATVQHKSLAC